MLTPMEIHNKEFSKKMRGYDIDEVNRFLDEVVRDFETIIQEQHDLEDQLEDALQRLDRYSNIEDSLNKSIVVAQQTADRLRESSEKEADAIIAEAHRSAELMLKDAVEKANSVAEETEDLRRQSSIFRQRLQLMLETQIELVKNDEWEKLLQSSTFGPGQYEVIDHLNDQFNEVEESAFQPVFEDQEIIDYSNDESYEDRENNEAISEDTDEE